MKILTLFCILTITASADTFNEPPGGRGHSRETTDSGDTRETRDREDTDWTRVSNPPSVPEPDSPVVLLTAAGAVLLSRRSRTTRRGRWVRERRIDLRTVEFP